MAAKAADLLLELTAFATPYVEGRPGQHGAAVDRDSDYVYTLEIRARRRLREMPTEELISEPRTDWVNDDAEGDQDGAAEGME